MPQPVLVWACSSLPLAWQGRVGHAHLKVFPGDVFVAQTRVPEGKLGLGLGSGLLNCHQAFPTPQSFTETAGRKETVFRSVAKLGSFWGAFRNPIPEMECAGPRFLLGVLLPHLECLFKLRDGSYRHHAQITHRGLQKSLFETHEVCRVAMCTVVDCAESHRVMGCFFDPVLLILE